MENSTPSTERWEQIIDIWHDHKWLYGAAGYILGLLTFPALQRFMADFAALLNDLVPEMFGIIFTVLFIDALYRIRDSIRQKRELQQQLLRDFGSRDNSTAIRAVEILRDHGWHADGTLCNLKLKYANLKNADLDRADLRSTRLWGADLRRIDATHVNFEKGSLDSSDLRDARFNMSNFKNAGINYADARDADFRGCDLRGAFLYRTDFKGCNFWAADLRGTRLLEANLELVNLEDAKFNEETVFPDGKHWSTEIDISRYTEPNHPDFWRPADDSWLYSQDDDPAPWWLREQEKHSDFF